jgi:aminopeptidase N
MERRGEFGENAKMACCGRRGHGGEFAGPEAEEHYPPDLALEPKHLAIEIALDVDAERATARVVTTVEGRLPEARELWLDAVGFRDVRVEGLGGRSVRHAYDGKRLRLTWDAGFAVGERRDVAIAYVVEKPATGLFFMHPTAAEPQRPIYAATDHETERARYWLPCVDLPNVRTTLDFAITAKAELTILANGKLVGETPAAGGLKTARWRLEQPCPSYLVCFAVGDFVRHDDGDVAGVPVASFTSKEFTSADLARTFGRTRKMLEWLNGKLGSPYPYPKYYQFALPMFSGAMENISLVSWSDQFVVTDAMAGEMTWLTDQINVHEMAHAWFGDQIVVRDFAHAWLKEGWATYLEVCWLEYEHGADEQHYDLYRNAQRYGQESDEGYARPIVTRKFTSSWQMYDNHLYPGAGWRLHMLRHELGDATFWAAVRDYVAANRYGVVETDDFRKALEKRSGRSLVKFFDQWLLRPGYPQLKVAFSYDGDKQVGTFEIEQKQVDEKRGIGLFALRAELAWTIGDETTLRTVAIDKGKHVFAFPMSADPAQVRFDPGVKLLCKLEFDPGPTKLKKQLTEANDVIGRIHAAKTLCESGDRGNLAAVIAAYAGETFWGVKREMLRAIAATNTEAALAALVGIVGSETDPMVLDQAMQATEAYRDERVRKALEARLARDDLPPGAAGAAVTALGAQRDARAVPVLKAIAEQAAAPWQVRAAAFSAIGATRDETAESYLVAKAAAGALPYRVRRGAMVGLSHLAPYLERKGRENVEASLVTMLRDDDGWVGAAAVRALREGRLSGATPALEAYRVTVSQQEQVAVTGAIKALARGEEPKVAALEKQVDDLKEKLRKLSDRLQELEDKAR